MTNRLITLATAGLLSAMVFAVVGEAQTPQAPVSATYITQLPNSTLTGEQALSLLPTGLLRVQTATGIISSLTNSAALAANLSDETGAGPLVFSTSPVIASPQILGAMVLPDGVRQLFNPNEIVAGLNVGSFAGNPLIPENGDLWYDNLNHALKTRINGIIVSLGPLGAPGGGGGITQLIGDVLAGPGTGIVVATLAAGAVGFDNLPDLPSPSLFGRGSTGGGGDPQIIALGAGLTMNGTTLSATGLAISDIVDGTITNADISNTAAIALTKLQDIAAVRVLGRGSVGAGPPQELTLGTGLTITGTTLAVAVGGVSGIGDVVGPAGGTTIDHLALWADTAGKLLKNSTIHVSTVALKNADNVFVAQTLADGTTINGPNSQMSFYSTGSAAENRRWRVVNYGDGNLRFEALNDAATVVQATPLILYRNGNIGVSGSINAAGGIGSTPIAMTQITTYTPWTNVPYDPGLFTNPAGTWTVQPADFQQFNYTIIDKTMLVSFSFVNTSVVGSSTLLYVPIPTGRLPIGGFYNRVITQGTVSDFGIVQVQAGDNRIQFHNFGGWDPQGGPDSLHITGQIAFGIY